MLKKLVLVAAAIGFVGYASAASAQANHYGCYQIKDLKNPKFDNTATYSVPTQVGLEAGVAKCKPKFLCMPSAKEGNPIIDPALHYLCYQCKGSKLAVNYDVTDQFGGLDVATKKFKLICNPATKAPL